MRASRRRFLSILVVVGLTLAWAALAFAAGSVPVEAATLARHATTGWAVAATAVSGSEVSQAVSSAVSPTGLTLLGTGLVGIALLVAGAQAVLRGFGETRED